MKVRSVPSVVVTIAWWVLGYGIAEGGNGAEGLPGNKIFGGSGFFFHFDQIANDLRTQSPFVRADDMKVLHQLVIGERIQTHAPQ